MIDKVFVDTNIVLDFLAKRIPFFSSAQNLFKLAELNELELQIGSISWTNLEYILGRTTSMKKIDIRNSLKGLRLISSVCTTGEKEIDLALISKMADFEDAVQYYTALNNSSNVIITRNLKDFKLAEIPVMTAEDYLKSRAF